MSDSNIFSLTSLSFLSFLHFLNFSPPSSFSPHLVRLSLSASLFIFFFYFFLSSLLRGLCGFCGSVCGRLLQAVVVVGVLSLVAVVGRWDGFNDPWVWWIGFASVAVVQSGVVSGGWVSDPVCFYMDFMISMHPTDLDHCKYFVL